MKKNFKLEEIKERFWDFLSASLIFIPFLGTPLIIVAPSVIHLLGWERAAFVVLAVLWVLLALYLILAIVMFFIMMREQNADRMNRWVYYVGVIAGSMLVGTIIAKVVGII